MRQPRTNLPADTAEIGADAARQEPSPVRPTEVIEAAPLGASRDRPEPPRVARARRGRLQAIGLLLLALAAAYAVGLHWWWTAPMLAMGQRMDELRAQELRLRMAAQQRPAIERALAEVRRSEESNPAFLPEASVELAQAGLSQRIEAEVGAVSPDHGGCSISQRTPTPATEPERYQRVIVQVRLLCGMNEFSALLHAIEGGRPQLFVSNLNIIGRVGAPAPAGAAASVAAPLDIAFDVYGYLRPGIGAPATPANGGGDAAR